MKTAGIIKIVIGGVLILALVAVAAGMLLGRNLWSGEPVEVLAVTRPEAAPAAPPEKAPENAPENVPDNALEKAPAAQGGQEIAPKEQPQTAAAIGDARYALSALREIDVEWIAGSVTIKTGMGEDVIIYETSDETLTEAQRMRCTVQDGKLRVAFCDDIKNVWRWFVAGNHTLPAKALTIELPAGLAELDIHTVAASVSMDATCAVENDVESVSGDVRFTDLQCREISITTTSGKIRIADCIADSLDTETVSGEAEVSGAFGNIESQSVSGDYTVLSTSAPREIEAQTVSGSIRVTLPKDAEFTATLDSVSGELSSEFAGTMSKDRLVCGSGANRYEFESISGDVHILAG